MPCLSITCLECLDFENHMRLYFEADYCNDGSEPSSFEVI